MNIRNIQNLQIKYYLLPLYKEYYRKGEKNQYILTVFMLKN